MDYIGLIFLGFFLFHVVVDSYFYFSKNADLNRELWKWRNILSVVLFFAVGIGLLMTTAPPPDAFYWVLFLVFIILASIGAYFGIQNTKFCNRCGRKVNSLMGAYVSPEFCPRCGSKLE